MRGRLLCSVVLAALPACDRLQALMDLPETPPMPQRPAPARNRPPPAASTGVGEGRDAGPPPSMPLDIKVRRAMRLAPLRTHEPGVAIARGRIAVLASDALVVRDSSKFEEVARIPLHRPRILTVLADGSFLSADAAHTVWLLPHDTKARKLPRIALMMASTLFPDRRTPERFWALPAFGNTLYSSSISRSSFSRPFADSWVSLDDFDSQALGSLRDGSFLYTTPSGFRQFYGPAKKEDIAGNSRGVVRILPGSRPDTVWVVTAERAVLYRLLANKLVHLRVVELEAMPYDVEADGAYLAVLELVQPADAPWSFRLEVFDVEGRRHVREALTAEESLDEKTWLSTLTRNRRLALSASPPLVAIGGPDSLTVLRADDGTHLTKP